MIARFPRNPFLDSFRFADNTFKIRALRHIEGTAESGLSRLRSAEKIKLVSWLDANGAIKIGAFVEHTVLHH